jgi:hypothetical protein
VKAVEGDSWLPKNKTNSDGMKTYTTSGSHRECPISFREDKCEDLIAASNYICRLDIVGRRDLPVVPLLTSDPGK